MRHLLLAGLCALGCSRAPLDGGGNDGAPGAVDLRAPGGADLGSFCGDPGSPRIEVNGMLANSPATSAHAVILNCCDAAELDYVSMQIPEPIVLAWRHSAGTPPNPPVTLDLANLPSGWSVMVYSGCSPTQPGCVPDDAYTTGFTGTLTVSLGSAGYQMSVCAEASEPAGAPHPVLHSLRLWSPTIIAQ